MTSNKTVCTAEYGGASDGSSRLAGLPLPDSVVYNEILKRLDLESLCSLSFVSRSLRCAVSLALSTVPSLDLSGFSPNRDILRCIFSKCRGVKSVTIDCLRLDDSSIMNILEPNIQELNLLKCASLSCHVLAAIGKRCPDLRILVLEIAAANSSNALRNYLLDMLEGLPHLESLNIKVRGAEFDKRNLPCIELNLPKTLKSLKLQTVNARGSAQLIRELRDNGNRPGSVVSLELPSYTHSPYLNLQWLSLVLKVISDELVISIANSLPLLVELDIEDRPCSQPMLPSDLSNTGLQSLSSCQHLVALSIIRSRLNYPASFRRINDLGLFLLSEGCKSLESVRLGGFSTVTDAGFSSILRSCYNLKKFEVRNAPLLSDLTFHDIIGVVSPLTELKLSSCNLITSEAVAELASSCTLEMLDTFGCRSIADPCLNYISSLSTLTNLNLAGADITDTGLATLGRGRTPITRLCLRGCKRVSDRGIFSLLNGGETIKKTLSSLDLGCMPGISDAAIHSIASTAESITELCIRYCFHVTDASLKILGSERKFTGGGKLIRQLDLSHCIHLSDGLVKLLQNHSFRGLRWLGVGGTYLDNKNRGGFDVVCEMRPWLTVCFECCEVGCHDGWQFHK